jgi:hypothetical protein
MERYAQPLKGLHLSDMKSVSGWGMQERIWDGFASQQAWKANCEALCFSLFEVTTIWS